ncbi:hypothetical protein MPTK1_3g00090 [Marchantia polymorpha subsp. ruderalis]
MDAKAGFHVAWCSFIAFSLQIGGYRSLHD